MSCMRVHDADAMRRRAVAARHRARGEVRACRSCPPCRRSRSCARPPPSARCGRRCAHCARHARMSAVTVDRAPAPSLRPMREADLPTVIAIEQRAYAFPWTQGVFRDCLLANHPAWVLVEDGAIIGYAVLSVAADEAHVLNLCTAPEVAGPRPRPSPVARADATRARARRASRVPRSAPVQCARRSRCTTTKASTRSAAARATTRRAKGARMRW